MAGKSCTNDELAHLTAGHAYWSGKGYQLQPENGILPQRWLGLAALANGSLPPDPLSPAWAVSDVWTLGLDYLKAPEHPVDVMLMDARMMAAAWSVATGLLVYLLSRRLFGAPAAFVSLLLFCLAPEFLANGPLATSDVCGCFFLLLSTSLYWRHLYSGRLSGLLASALGFGLACTAKFSAILLIPVFLLLGFVPALLLRLSPGQAAQPPSARAPLRELAKAALVHAAVALLVIWSFYGFTFAPPGRFLSYQFTWEHFRTLIGWKADMLRVLSGVPVFPQPYVFGFAHVLSLAAKRGCFLAGDSGITGWWYFFPFAFLVKSTLATLSLGLFLPALAAKAWLAKAFRRDWSFTRSPVFLGLLPLFLFSAVYGLVSLTMSLNIGHRHILPLYPPLYVAAGGAFAWLWRRRRLTALAAALLLVGCQALESFAVRPHYLSFFNAAAGGPSRGYQLLVDSSLDWGQDWPLVAEWLDKDSAARAGMPVYAAGFGVAEIPYYLPRARILARVPMNERYTGRYKAEPGLYCVSATMLQQPYLQPRDWNMELEGHYQAYRAQAHRVYDHNRETQPPAAATPEAAAFWHQFQALRFMRLAGWLRRHEPVALVGNSVLIYRLDEKALHAALEGTLQEWAATP